jgi:hypothetical protein
MIPHLRIKGAKKMSQNLNQKIVQIMSEVNAVGKTGYNDRQDYKYAQAVDVIREVRTLLVAQGLRLKSEVTSIERQPCGKMTLATITIQYTLIDTETGETETSHMIAEGADTGDKAINKAMTSGLKYFFRDTFMLDFADDAEATTSNNNQSNKQRSQQQTQRKQYQQKQPAQQSSAYKMTEETLTKIKNVWNSTALAPDLINKQTEKYFKLPLNLLTEEQGQKLLEIFAAKKSETKEQTKNRYASLFAAGKSQQLSNDQVKEKLYEKYSIDSLTELNDVKLADATKWIKNYGKTDTKKIS